MRRLAGDHVAAGVHPRGFSGIDTPALIAGVVIRDGGFLAREASRLLQKNEAAVEPKEEIVVGQMINRNNPSV